MKCIITSFQCKTRPARATYPNRVEIMTGESVSSRIRLFGEVFEVEEIRTENATGLSTVKMICQEFPTEKEALFLEGGLDVEYELVESSDD